MFQFIKHKRENILNLLSIKAKIKYERVCKHIINFSVLVIYIFYIFDLAQRYKGLRDGSNEFESLPLRNYQDVWFKL